MTNQANKSDEIIKVIQDTVELLYSQLAILITTKPRPNTLRNYISGLDAIDKCWFEESSPYDEAAFTSVRIPPETCLGSQSFSRYPLAAGVAYRLGSTLGERSPGYSDTPNPEISDRLQAATYHLVRQNSLRQRESDPGMAAARFLNDNRRELVRDSSREEANQNISREILEGMEKTTKAAIQLLEEKDQRIEALEKRLAEVGVKLD